MDRREVGCVVVAFALIVIGTFSTGLLPPTTPYQVLAGAIIVAGFALPFFCLRD